MYVLSIPRDALGICAANDDRPAAGFTDSRAAYTQHIHNDDDDYTVNGHIYGGRGGACETQCDKLFGASTVAKMLS